ASSGDIGTVFFFSSRRRHTRWPRDWSSDVCSSDLANQKTCYAEALRAGADIVVMVHPDYQYDPRLVPQIIEPIVRGDADVVLGSRLKEGSALAQGMPWWKYLANRFLTGLENRVFSLSLSES